MKTTFEDWFLEDVTGGSAKSNAYYTVAQEFQSGDVASQMKALEEIMKQAWDARYYTLTYQDL